MFFLYSKINNLVKEAMKEFKGLKRGFTSADVLNYHKIANTTDLSKMDDDTFYKLFSFYLEAAPYYNDIIELYEEEKKKKDCFNQIDDLQVEPLTDSSLVFLNSFSSIKGAIEKLESIGKDVKFYKKIQEKRNQQYLERIGGISKYIELLTNSKK